MNNVHGGNIYQFSKQNNIPLNKIIDFSSNVNWWGPPPKLIKLIKENSKEIIHYPEITNQQALLEALKINSVFILQPNFSEYERAATAKKIKIRYITTSQKNNFKASIENISKKVKDNSILFLSSPNNPVGYFYDKDELMEIVSILKNKKSFLFVDEAFIDFLKIKNLSFINRILKFNNLIILRSLTKIFAIPGLRLGVLAADESIIKKINNIQPPWQLNYFAQLTAINIFRFENFRKSSLKKLFVEKQKLISELEKNKNLKVFNSEANFILCKIKNRKTVEELQEFLIPQNIMLRNCSNYKGLNNFFFRISVRKSKENKLLTNSLKEFFDV